MSGWKDKEARREYMREYHRLWRRKERKNNRMGFRPSSAWKKSDEKVEKKELLERWAEVPVDTRTLTQRICGDPLPGRSALERRGAGA